MLRHTRQATTSNVYVHLLEEVKLGAADSVDGVLSDLTARRAERGKRRRERVATPVATK
ncbi:hypothetical protein GCM10022252_07870 [Streptosporangium oxazolinicum]|uniref:Integrase n=1 Tax=Streptosporangium oxazolinicum TaxID=909287 RepID=A0ABP8ADW6_9ACTN